MRKFIVAAVAAGIVFAGVYGMAASLNVSSGTLGAGTATVAACQSGTLNVSYTAGYSSSIPGYAATQVSVSNIDTASNACGGKSIRVTLVDSSNNSLGEATGSITAGGSSTFTASVTGVSASSVSGVHVAITG